VTDFADSFPVLFPWVPASWNFL